MIWVQSRIEPDDRAVGIYHIVNDEEGFEETAQILFELVKSAEQEFPGRERLRYLDIQGHKNDQGGFDADMMEIQTKFVTGFLSNYLSEFSTPLGHFSNPKRQDNDVPPALVVRDK